MTKTIKMYRCFLIERELAGASVYSAVCGLECEYLAPDEHYRGGVILRRVEVGQVIFADLVGVVALDKLTKAIEDHVWDLSDSRDFQRDICAACEEQLASMVAR